MLTLRVVVVMVPVVMVSAVMMRMVMLRVVTVFRGILNLSGMVFTVSSRRAPPRNVQNVAASSGLGPSGGSRVFPHGLTIYAILRHDCVRCCARSSKTARRGRLSQTFFPLFVAGC